MESTGKGRTRPNRVRVIRRVLGTVVMSTAIAIFGAAVVVGPATAAIPHRSSSLSVVSISPVAGAKGVSGTAPITIEFSGALSTKSALPTLQPAVAGSWKIFGQTMKFTPSGAYLPGAVESVVLPETGAHVVTGQAHQHLFGASTYTFTVEGGSVLRVQQLLARLGYLPLQWIPANRARLTANSLARTAFTAPAGTFSWRYSAPPTLATLWHPGSLNILVTGALITFEEDRGIATGGGTPTGVLGAGLWSALLQAGSDPPAYANRFGYVYALASQASPETLTVWRNGVVAVRSPANTGISVAPTANGNFTVYLRYANQIMRGVNPSGSHYADPVSWVAYFNGGDAVHYFPRSSFGYPQSLGCVELPYAAAAKAWPLLRIGTIVTVAA